jgi:hypothetical protein
MRLLYHILSAFGRRTFHPRPQDGVFRCDLNKSQLPNSETKSVWSFEIGIWSLFGICLPTGRQACLPVGREFVIWDFWCYALCHYLRERHHFKIPLRGRVLRRSGVPSHPRFATATPKLIIHI